MIGLLISPLLIIMIFLVILFSVFILKMHIDFTKKTATTLVVKKFFHPKSKPRKTCSSKSLGFSDASKQNDPIDRSTAAAPHTKNPRFYSYVPFDDSVFLTRTKKLTKKKNSFFQFCLFLKKREKNLKEKNPSELLYKALMTTFLITLTINMRWHFLNVFNLIY